MYKKPHKQRQRRREEGESKENPQVETTPSVLPFILIPSSVLSRLSFPRCGMLVEDSDHNHQVQALWSWRLSAPDVSCVTVFESACMETQREALRAAGMVSCDN